jgi:aminoglycoside phosphotransferase (APT) family kinase protein
VLDQLAADLDVLPGVARWGLADEMRAAIAQALRRLPASLADRAVEWRHALESIVRDQGAAAQREICALRSLSADIVRALADAGRASSDAGGASPDTGAVPGRAGEIGSRGASWDASSDADLPARVIASLGALDHRWLTSYDAAQKARSAEGGSAPAQGKDTSAESTAATQHTSTSKPAATAEPASIPEPTAASVTDYLRARFPGEPLAATKVVPIPGGRSKKTFFISLETNSRFPSELVMRQDYALRYEATKVRDEYTPLRRLAELGLAVPRPLHLEAKESTLGPPFLLVERLRGGPPGSYLFGVRAPCPGAFRDLARVLAQLHRATPKELGFAPSASGGSDRLLELIETYQGTWRENAMRASPLIDYAYSWARCECAKDAGSLAVVHGDAGPYNLLVDGDRLSALLDWEFAHVGDPAVDLGIARVYAEDMMSWDDDFLGHYRDAGGPVVPESRVRLGMLVNFLKGTTLVATSGRNFEEGWTREFVKGANSFTGLRIIELRIAGLLERFGAV